MHSNSETLGQVIKKARKHNNLTIEALAEKIGVSERYLYRIENEDKKPSFSVLYNLIRYLSISSDLIFYPEKTPKDSEIDDIIHMLYSCNKRDLKIIRAMVWVMCENNGD